MEWTQQPGVGPGAEILGADLTGRRMVELGCGAGHNTAHLAAAGATIVGLDSSAGQIRRAVAYYGHTGARFLHTSAAHHLDHATESLDAIVSVFGAIGTTEPTQLLAACSHSLAHQGVLAFCVPHPRRTGTVPLHPYTCAPVTLPDGTSHIVERWDMEPAAWILALNRAGLTATAVHHLHAPADTRWPTTLLITARKP
jgi:SAM-dependent methyltransferase